MTRTMPQILADRAKQDIDLSSARLGDEYFYHSLSFCVIDAVFSIGVRYGGVVNVVRRYAAHYGLELYRRGPEYPEPASQDTLEELVERMEGLSVDTFMDEVFQNRQRTSTRSGIRKAEAVLRFAKCLLSAGVSSFGQVERLLSSDQAEREIKLIPGQGSGLSYEYFLMLAGSEGLIKADRWILRYLKSALGREVAASEAVHIVKECAELLEQEFPGMTPRLLDHEIWKHQRSL